GTAAKAWSVQWGVSLLDERWEASTLRGAQCAGAAATSDVDDDGDAAVVGGAVDVVLGAAGVGAAAGAAGTAMVRVATRGAAAGRAGAVALEAAGAWACSGKRKISVTYRTLPAQ